MATATELTLTLGRTVYAGDPDSDERIQARETRVSVTWSLGEDEQDLTLTTSALAEEAERALAHVGQPRQTATIEAQQIESRQSAPTKAVVGTSHSANGADGNGITRPGNGNGCNHQAGVGSAKDRTSTPEATTSRYGGYVPSPPGNGHAAGTGDTRSRSLASPIEKAPAITRAQCLAVNSHCTRRGIAAWELMRLVAEQFGKRNLEDLDKAQRGELLTMLQQADQEGGNPDYAN